MSKSLYLIAGANGSGKSTIARLLLPQKELVFVNPDEIAKELCPEDPPCVRIEAGRIALTRIKELLTRGASFAIESTLSGRAHLSLVREAQCAGYHVTLVYSFLDTVDACIARIALRVKAGGHYVPDEDVRRRYLRSKRNFIEVYSPAVDDWMLYYNGDSDPILVAVGGAETEEKIVSPRLFKLFKEDLCPTT